MKTPFKRIGGGTTPLKAVVKRHVVEAVAASPAPSSDSRYVERAEVLEMITEVRAFCATHGRLLKKDQVLKALYEAIETMRTL